MKLPPMFARIEFARTRSRWPALWLPIGLLWPIVIVLCAPLVVFGFVFAQLVRGYSSTHFLQLCRVTYVLVCEARGTRVDVRGPATTISIAIC
jgi:hypothetical protein